MKKGFFILVIFLFQFSFSQIDSLSDVIAKEKIPVSQSKLNASQIQTLNLAKDVPLLLNHTVSAVATSDAGNGVGYTSLRIRGTDATKTLVAIDGVPINDSESQTVFWVDMPDVVSTSQNVIIERGIGESSNGMANFGASINISNAGMKDTAQISYNGALGTFQTYKNSLITETGNLLGKKWKVKARVSQLLSNGYIDRSWARLWAYQLQSSYLFNKNSQLDFNFYGGKEKTYQAWYGIDSYTLETNRKFNFAGAIYDENNSITGFYPNQIDHYLQNHYTLKWNEKFNSNWVLTILSFYTFGKGYYEEYQQNQYLPDYKFSETNYSDLVRQKWLKNHFYGISANLKFNQKNWFSSFQFGLNQYLGNHFGEVINSSVLPLSENQEFYRNNSEKNEFVTFLKQLYRINKVEIYADLQYRFVHYQAQTKENGISSIESNPNFLHNYAFLNPKLGLNYYLKNQRVYFLIGLSHREPTRTDLIENPSIKPERLRDIELGLNSTFQKINFVTNFYWMNYSNQLILTGRLDDVGNPIRENSGKSFRLGWETEITYHLNSWLNFWGNFTLSTNKNKSYTWLENGSSYSIKNSSIAYSPSIITNFGLQLKAIKSFDFQLINKYVSTQFLDNSQSSHRQLSSYNLWDFYLTYKPHYFQKNNFEFNAQFYNLLNKKYVNNGYVYDNTPYYYPQAGFNFLIGIKWVF